LPTTSAGRSCFVAAICSAYEKAADDELLWRVRRLLLPGEDIDGLMDRILK
jgi:hypothetical protein